jgi:hypothetical protein
VSITEATFSSFLRDPNKVLRSIEDGDVILHRRDEPALRVSLEDRAHGTTEGVALAAHLLRDLLHDDHVRQRLIEAFSEEAPWLRFLPEADRDAFIQEFVSCAEASGKVGVLSPLTEMLTAWRSTAAAYADGLADELRRPLPGDGGVVSAPASA